MMRSEIIAQLDASGVKAGICVSRFNELCTEGLLRGAKRSFQQLGGNLDNLTTIWVPGAFEIPSALSWMAQSRKFELLVCLGAVIRGATTHYDYVCSQVTSGISKVAADSSLPISFGILTTDNLEQAMERSGSKAGNKGYDAMNAAIEMYSLKKEILADS